MHQGYIISYQLTNAYFLYFVILNLELSEIQNLTIVSSELFLMQIKYLHTEKQMIHCKIIVAFKNI
jgi:hypothetical protein